MFLHVLAVGKLTTAKPEPVRLAACWTNSFHRFDQFGSIIDTIPRRSPVLYIHQPCAKGESQHATLNLPTSSPRPLHRHYRPQLSSQLSARSRWRTIVVVRCKVPQLSCAITVTFSRRSRASLLFIFIYKVWLINVQRPNCARTLQTVQLLQQDVWCQSKGLRTHDKWPASMQGMGRRPVHKSRPLTFSSHPSNAVKDRSTKAINSVGETVLIPGKPVPATDTDTGIHNPSLMDTSNGTRCRTPRPSRVSTKVVVVVVAEVETESVSLYPFSLISQKSNSSGAVKGLVSTIKGLVSQNQQPQPYQQLQPPQPPQQYPGAVNPPYLQQIPGHISPNPPLISPPITPMSSGMNSPMSSGMGGLMSPGMSTPSTSNQQYYDPPSPTSPDIQDPDVNDQTNGQHSPPHQLPGSYIPSQSSTSGQKSKTMNVAMKPPMNSTGGGNYDPNFDPHADPNHDPMVTSSQFSGPGQNTGGSLPIQAQAHAQLTVQVTSPPVSAGGHGNGYWDQNDPNNFLPQQSTLNSSNSSMTCRLNGCNKPVFVDPATHYQSEYCSQRHRE